MNYKVGYDPDFYCKFSIGEDDMLVNMFWRDGETLSNYYTFREVPMFDSTFMMNVYQKPLVCFIGNDNHRSMSYLVLHCLVMKWNKATFGC